VLFTTKAQNLHGCNPEMTDDEFRMFLEMEYLMGIALKPIKEGFHNETDLRNAVTAFEKCLKIIDKCHELYKIYNYASELYWLLARKTDNYDYLYFYNQSYYLKNKYNNCLKNRGFNLNDPTKEVHENMINLHRINTEKETAKKWHEIKNSDNSAIIKKFLDGLAPKDYYRDKAQKAYDLLIAKERDERERIQRANDLLIAQKKAEQDELDKKDLYRKLTNNNDKNAGEEYLRRFPRGENAEDIKKQLSKIYYREAEAGYDIDRRIFNYRKALEYGGLTDNERSKSNSELQKLNIKKEKERRKNERREKIREYEKKEKVYKGYNGHIGFESTLALGNLLNEELVMYADIGTRITRNVSSYFGFDILKLKFAYNCFFSNLNNNKDFDIFNLKYSYNRYEFKTLQILTGIRFATPYFGRNKKTHFYTSFRAGAGWVDYHYLYSNNTYDSFIGLALGMEGDLGLRLGRFFIGPNVNYIKIKDLEYERVFFGLRTGIDFGIKRYKR